MSPLIDTAIGLCFIYFLTSLLCSHFCEFIAQKFFAYRSKFLEMALRNMLQGGLPADPKADIVQAFFDHSLIQGLTEPDPATGQPAAGDKPSYIPARTFALALLNVIAPQQGQANTLTQIRAQVALLPDQRTRESLLALIDAGEGDLATALSNIEQWFDGVMDRASGWYKRQTKSILLGLAVVIVLFFNLDSLQIAQSLWQNPTLRVAVADAAQKRVETDLKPKGKTTKDKAAEDTDNQGNNNAATAGDDNTGAAPGSTNDTGAESGSDSSATLTTINADLENLKALQALQLPIGWSLNPQSENSLQHLASLRLLPKLLGWAITIACVCLGAPFWFNLLNQFVNLRRSGPPPRSAT